MLHIVGGRPREELPAPASSTTWRSRLGPQGDARGRSMRAASNTSAGSRSGTGIWQVFVHDPNGAKVELDFSPEESALNDRRYAAAGRSARPSDRRRGHARRRHRIRRRHHRRHARTRAASTSRWARTTRSVRLGDAGLPRGDRDRSCRDDQARSTALVRSRPTSRACRPSSTGAAATHPLGSRGRSMSSAPPRAARSRSAPVHPMARGVLSMADHDPDDGKRPAKGIVPTLIQPELLLPHPAEVYAPAPASDCRDLAAASRAPRQLPRRQALGGPLRRCCPSPDDPCARSPRCCEPRAGQPRF